MRSAMSVQLEETACGGHASLQPADASTADFLEHVTAACPRSVTHAGQKGPQFCGIGRSWMLNKLYFELALHGETLLCGSHHVVRRRENTCDLREMWLVVYGYAIKSVMWVSVQCVKT